MHWGAGLGFYLSTVAVGMSGLFLWFVVRRQRLQFFLPILKLLTRPPYILQRLLLRRPPWRQFLCFLAMVGILSMFFGQAYWLASSDGDSGERVHIFVDMSPSVAAKVTLDEVLTKVSELERSFPGVLSFSTSHSPEVWQGSGVRLRELGFHRAGMEIAELLQAQWNSFANVDRLIILSDRDFHSWRSFAPSFFTIKPQIILKTWEEKPNLANVFVAGVAIQEDLHPRGFVVTLQRTAWGAASGKLQAVSGSGTVLRETEWQFAGESLELYLPVYLRGDLVGPLLWKILPSGRDDLLMDNDFRLALHQAQALVIADPGGERSLEDPALRVLAALQALGWRVERQDALLPSTGKGPALTIGLLPVKGNCKDLDVSWPVFLGGDPKLVCKCREALGFACEGGGGPLFLDLSLSHGDFPIYMRGLLAGQDLGWQADWDREAKSPWLGAELSNVPLGESRLLQLSWEMLPNTAGVTDRVAGVVMDEAQTGIWLWGLVALLFLVFFFELGLLGLPAALFLAFFYSSDLYGELQIFQVGRNEAPTSWLELSHKVKQRTSVGISYHGHLSASLDKRALQQPWLWLSDLGPEADQAQFELWLQRGGFLILQGLGALAHKRKVFKRGRWRKLGLNDGLLRSFYLFSSGLPNCAGPWQGWFFDGRLAAVSLPFNLLDQLKDGAAGRTETCLDRETYLRLFINITLTALTTDYKEEQLHVETVLKQLQ